MLSIFDYILKFGESLWEVVLDEGIEFIDMLESDRLCIQKKFLWFKHNQEIILLSQRKSFGLHQILIDI